MEKIDYRFEVKRYNGVPTLFICDKPVHGSKTKTAVSF